MQILYSLSAGLAVGGIFALLNLEAPAPPTISGVMGIVGMTIGYLIVGYLK